MLFLSSSYFFIILYVIEKIIDRERFRKKLILATTLIKLE